MVYVNGFVQDEHYQIQDKDVVSVREFPAGVAIGVGLSVAIGGWIVKEVGDHFGWWDAIGNKFKGWLTNWLGVDNNKAVNEQDGYVSYPTVSGSKNQTALGKSIPLILGKTLFTPYIVGRPYTSIGGEDGKDVYFHALYLIGYNDIKVENIALGIYPIASNDGVTKGILPSQNYDKENPVIQCIDSGEIALNYESNSCHYDPVEYGMKLELQQGENEVSLYEQKVVQTDFNTELLYPKGTRALDVYAFSSKYPERLEVEIQFNGLVGYDNEGKKQNKTVEIGVSMSIDGGITWQEFTAFNGCNSSRVEDGETISVFTRAKNETMRFVATKEFTYEEINAFNNGDGIKNNVVELRIRKKTESSGDSNTADAVALSSVRTFCYDNKRSKEEQRLVKQVPMEAKYRNITARLGFVCKAGDEIQGQMESLNCICTSKARTWDGNKWSKTISPTNNPASLALLALTGKHRSQYAYAIDDSTDEPTSEKIDLESFGRAYEKCAVPTQYGDETLPRFSCDGAVLKKTKTIDMVNQILACCRGNVIMSGKKYGILLDEPRQYPVMLLNAQNILEQSNTKNFDEIPDALQVKYISAINNFKEDTFICKPNNCTIPESEMKLQSIELPFITHPFRAKALGLYQLASMKLRPETWQIKMAQDGNLIEVGNLVNIQNDTISVGIGFGAEIKGFIYDDELSPTKILAIITDGRFTVSEYTKDYGVIIQQADGINEPSIIKRKVKFTENGTYNELTFDLPISLDERLLPSVGDICSFGYFNSEITSALCLSKKDNGNGTFSLTFVPYQEGVYTADDGIIDDFDSKITPPQIKNVPPIEDKGLTLDQLNNAINNVSNGGEQSIPANISRVFALAQKDDILLSFETLESGLNNSATSYKCEIKKGTNAEWESFDLLNNSYIFDREVDGYLEYSDLQTWKIRAKAVNIYGKESAEWTETFVNTVNYGTWEVTKPVIVTRVSDRTITLMISQSPRSDSRVVYGDVKYKVQIKRPDTDTQYYKPATDKNPYPDVNAQGEITNGNEDNYKDDLGYVLSNGVYIQTLPLKGQSSNDIKDTLYSFKVVAFNEKNEDSIATEISETARCTSIRDIVKANATDKDAYIQNLTSLCSAFGFISDGTTPDNIADLLNYWTLNDGILTDPKYFTGNNIGMKGAFRVGGKNQYLLCRPYVTATGETDYEIKFCVGNFEISTTSSNINGNLIVRQNDNALDQTLITPTGTYFQHRNSTSATFYTVAQIDTSGVVVPVLRNDKQLLIGNADQKKTRELWHDIGKKYLTNNALVYHFDDNIYSQNNVSDGLEVSGEQWALKNGDDNAMFTPAILAVAPYCQTARAIWGYFKLHKQMQNVRYATIDFWLQYFYAENQVLFNVGTLSDKIKLSVLPSEPEAVVSGVATWINESGQYIYTNCRNPDMFFENTDDNPNITRYAYLQRGSAENYEVGDYYITQCTYNDDYTVKSIFVEGVEYNFQYGYADFNYEIFSQEVDKKLAVQKNDKKTQIEHIGLAQTEFIELAAADFDFKQNTWIHIGVSYGEDKLTFNISDNNKTYSKEINRFSTILDTLDILINENQTQIIIDELYIDGSDTDIIACETTNDFNIATSNKIPWGALDYKEKHMILDAQDPTLFKSNIMDYLFNQFLNSEEFRNKVLEITNTGV